MSTALLYSLDCDHLFELAAAQVGHFTTRQAAWGRGTNRVIEACRAHGIPDPLFVDEAGAVTVTFLAEVVADMGRAVSHAGPMLVLSSDQVQVLDLAQEARSLPEFMTPSGPKNKTRFRDQIIAPLLDAGLLAMTVPDKPRSPKQQYQATAVGLTALQAARRS